MALIFANKYHSVVDRVKHVHELWIKEERAILF